MHAINWLAVAKHPKALYQVGCWSSSYVRNQPDNNRTLSDWMFCQHQQNTQNHFIRLVHALLKLGWSGWLRMRCRDTILLKNRMQWFFMFLHVCLFTTSINVMRSISQTPWYSKCHIPVLLWTNKQRAIAIYLIKYSTSKVALWLYQLSFYDVYGNWDGVGDCGWSVQTQFC